MSLNTEKLKEDLHNLIKEGAILLVQMCLEYDQKGTFKDLSISESEKKKRKKRGPFCDWYQIWYSEAKSVIRQVLPDRIGDFVRYYEKTNTRKELTLDNYRIEDCLQGLSTQNFIGEEILGPVAGIPLLRQQVAILISAERKFESSLFEIRNIVQADVFDSELEAASELLKSGYLRAAGALAGVVLEKHLAKVCEDHNLKMKSKKKKPTISDFNDLMKSEGVIDMPTWRKIQFLGDVRNNCAHNDEREPSKSDVEELIHGISKLIKSLF